MARIFKDNNNANDILNEVLSSGVAGISGGRLAVRGKLAEVRELAEQNSHENVVASSTINHPDTELAYVYDDMIYEKDNAVDEVIKSYEKVY